MDKQTSKYLSYTYQLLGALLLAVFIGKYLDAKIESLRMPLLIWALPCLVIIVSLLRIVQSTLKK